MTKQHTIYTRTSPKVTVVVNFADWQYTVVVTTKSGTTVARKSFAREATAMASARNWFEAYK